MTFHDQRTKPVHVMLMDSPLQLRVWRIRKSLKFAISPAVAMIQNDHGMDAMQSNGYLQVFPERRCPCGINARENTERGPASMFIQGRAIEAREKRTRTIWACVSAPCISFSQLVPKGMSSARKTSI